MAIGGTLGPQDYVTAGRLNLTPRPWLAAVGLCIIAGALMAAIDSGDWLPTIPLWMLGALVVFVLPYKVRRAFRQNKGLSDPIALQLRDNGILFAISRAEILLPWNKIYKWRANRKIILIYTAAKLQRHIALCPNDSLVEGIHLTRYARR